MKIYSVVKYDNGLFIGVDVNVPTSKELQSSTVRGDFKIVVTNFSIGKEKDYAVASFDLETDPALIYMGFIHKTQTTNTYSATGIHARENVLNIAADFLMGNDKK